MRPKCTSGHVFVRALLALITISTLTSCASYFLRKECEKVNWFQHGESVALQGRRLTGDERVKSCEKVEADVDHVALDRGFKAGMANYCTPETTFQTGKRGEFFNVEMCDGDQPRFLQKRHADGVKEYCMRSNGFSAGAKGKKYNGICPKDVEDLFLPEFNRGRKSYLSATIAANETRVSEIESSMRQIENERSMLMMQMSMMGSGQVVRREWKRDPVTGRMFEDTQVTEDPSVQSRRQSLQYDIDAKRRDLESKRAEQDQLRQTNRDMRIELSTLQ